jgi:hypothetical protein
MDVLFRTIHGSRLYNMHHADSDYDYYTVVDRVEKKKIKFAQQTIIDGVDSVVVDFGTWMSLVQKGVPQALEAMFSRQAEVDRLGAFRASFRVGSGAYETYLRTIKSFAMQEDIKHKRHALRLAMNLHSIRHFGYFNPTLAKNDVVLLTWLAEQDSETVLKQALDIAWA